MYHLVNEFPSGAARGADYISGASRGDITEIGADGDPVVRPERVLVTDYEIDFEGRLCFGERTVRHMAQMFGMVDGWRVDALQREFAAVRTERDELSMALRGAQQTVDNLLTLDRDRPAESFVAIDGSEHASRSAALSATRRAAKVRDKAQRDARPIRPDEAPEPKAMTSA